MVTGMLSSSATLKFPAGIAIISPFAPALFSTTMARALAAIVVFALTTKLQTPRSTATIDPAGSLVLERLIFEHPSGLGLPTVRSTSPVHVSLLPNRALTMGNTPEMMRGCTITSSSGPCSASSASAASFSATSSSPTSSLRQCSTRGCIASASLSMSISMLPPASAAGSGTLLTASSVSPGWSLVPGRSWPSVGGNDPSGLNHRPSDPVCRNDTSKYSYPGSCSCSSTSALSRSGNPVARSIRWMAWSHILRYMSMPCI